MDIEPNDPTAAFGNVSFVDCISSNNSGAAAYVQLKRLNASSSPLKITFQNFTILGGKSVGFAVGGIAPGVRGSIVLDGCHVSRTQGSGIFLYPKAAAGASLTVRRSTFDNTALCSGTGCKGMGPTPIQIDDPEGAVHFDVGGITFEDCELSDMRDRPWLEATALNATLANISFGFTVTNPHGCRETVQPHSVRVTVDTTCQRGDVSTMMAPTQLPSATLVVAEAKGFLLAITADCQAFLTDTTTAAVGSRTPFVMLYNRVNDSRIQNMEPCSRAQVAAPLTHAGDEHPNSTVTVLTLTAPHGYGEVMVSIRSSPGAPFITLSVAAVDGWKVDQKIMAFGEFWVGLGLDDASKTQVVMGKLQGPRSLTGLPIPPPPSAGFVTLSGGSYYRYIFNATAQQSVGFVYARTDRIDDAWQALAREDGGKARRTPDTPNGHGATGATGAWYWTDGLSNENNTDAYIARAKALGCSTLMLTGIVQGDTWQINRTAYSSGIRGTVDRIRQSGLRVGLHTLPYPPSTCIGACSKQNLLQEGLAPTYRSGSIGHSRLHHWYWTEDLGVWWGHEGSGTVAQNGNPTHNQYGYECPQLVRYNCSRWGSNMSLHHTSWSPLGKFRQGSSIGFDGTRSFGVVPQAYPGGDGIMAAGLNHTDGLTLGMVAHPATEPTVSNTVMNLAYLHGSFQLSLASASASASPAASTASAPGWHVRWSVWTAKGGRVLVAESATPCIVVGQPNIIKATFNGTGPSVHVFVNNVLVASTFGAGRPNHAGQPKPVTRLATLVSLPPIVFGVAATALPPAYGQGSNDSVSAMLLKDASAWYNGSLEEIYIKNVTTESRSAYVYTDNVRPNPADNVRLFDFLRPAGRSYFAGLMSDLLNSDGANFDVTQWDGFEIQLLVAGWDFPRSRRTASSGLYRGDPAPDWYGCVYPAKPPNLRAAVQVFIALMVKLHLRLLSVFCCVPGTT